MARKPFLLATMPMVTHRCQQGYLSLPSQKDTAILINTDQFPRTVECMPLPALPTALETAELLFQHVLGYFGLPKDVVSNRGPQFILRVSCRSWALFSALYQATIPKLIGKWRG